jgi:hypothetical protein
LIRRKTAQQGHTRDRFEALSGAIVPNPSMACLMGW